MSDIELALELLEQYKYFFWTDGVCYIKKAKQCATIDLNNRIELLNRIINNIELPNYVFLENELQSLENQLTHLNNL